VRDKPGIAARIFSDIGAAHIIVDMIVQNASIDGQQTSRSQFIRTSLENARTILMPVLGQLGRKAVKYRERRGKLSVVGIGMRSHSGVAARMFECLGRAGINIQMVSTVGDQDRGDYRRNEAERAARLIHSEFGLGRLLPVAVATQSLT